MGEGGGFVKSDGTHVQGRQKTANGFGRYSFFFVFLKLAYWPGPAASWELLYSKDTLKIDL